MSGQKNKLKKPGKFYKRMLKLLSVISVRAVIRIKNKLYHKYFEAEGIVYDVSHLEAFDIQIKLRTKKVLRRTFYSYMYLD